MFRLDGKMALASGAGRGLGVAQAPACQGAAVLINDGCAERAESAAALQAGEFSARAVPHRRHLP